MLPGKLFIKMFVGFWLACLAIVGSWYIAANYFDTLPERPPEHARPGPPPRFMLRLMYDLQTAAEQELPGVLTEIEQKHDIEVYLLNQQGSDIFDRPLSHGIEKVARQLKHRGRRAFGTSERGKVIGHKIYQNDLGPIRVVAVFPPTKPGVINALRQNLWLRVVLAILISGLICYLLSRVLTNRFKALQIVSRRWAEGDLTARVAVRQRGGDEADELARDFNAMATQLDDRIQAQKRLLSDVSHELRSPLARLRIALALTEKDSANSGRHLQRIELEATRLEALIDQLLRSQTGDISLDSHIDLVALLEELCVDTTFEGEAVGQQVILTTELDQALVASHADLLKKCFENILRNALKFSPSGATVAVSLEHRDQHYHVRIVDQGPGVPEPELAQIFEEFYRVDTARLRQTGGYGLGLSIAKRAVMLHRGEIRAENCTGGLAISVSLPGAQI